MGVILKNSFELDFKLLALGFITAWFVSLAITKASKFLLLARFCLTAALQVDTIKGIYIKGTLSGQHLERLQSRWKIKHFYVCFLILFIEEVLGKCLSTVSRKHCFDKFCSSFRTEVHDPCERAVVENPM